MEAAATAGGALDWALACARVDGLTEFIGFEDMEEGAGISDGVPGAATCLTDWVDGAKVNTARAGSVLDLEGASPITRGESWADMDTARVDKAEAEGLAIAETAAALQCRQRQSRLSKELERSQMRWIANSCGVLNNLALVGYPDTHRCLDFS